MALFLGVSNLITSAFRAEEDSEVAIPLPSSLNLTNSRQAIFTDSHRTKVKHSNSL